MPLSDREVKNVLGFYVLLRNIVLIAGVAVIAAAVVAVIAGAYNIGRKNGNAEAVGATVAPSGQAKHGPTPKARARAKSQEEIEALELQQADEAAGHTRTDLGLGEDDAKTTETGVETRPEARPDPSAVQRQDASAASPVPPPAVVGRQTLEAFGAPTSDTTPLFSVTVHQKKHGWPRRFFGAIGRGVGKAFRVR
jgi:hypothetical protein